MSEERTIEGIVHKVGAIEPAGNSEKRVIVVEEHDGRNGDYNQFISVEFYGDKALSGVTSISEGDLVKMSINLKGRKYQKDGETRFFNSIGGWRCDVLKAGEGRPSGVEDEIPF